MSDNTWYVVVPIGGGANGETLGVFEREDDALYACEEWVQQYICDHLRHQLPLKVTEEVSRRFDIKMFKAAEEVPLPFQRWVDEYYQETKESKAEGAVRDYKRYLELKEKFEGPGKENLKEKLRKIERNLLSGMPCGSRTQVLEDLGKVIASLEDQP